MILTHTKDDDDLKFLFYYYDRSTQFVKGDKLSYGGKDGLDSVVEQVFCLANEEFDQKKLAEFRRIRRSPAPTKATLNTPPSNGASVLDLLNYINVVKSALTAGSLRHREYIAEFTRTIGNSIRFDPEFYFLDIRAGLITSVEEAEGMDKLYCEHVSAGKEYFICSGLRSVYSKEELLGNTYLFLLNIKSVRFRGLKSEGMICCTEGQSIEAIRVAKREGTKIELEGFLSLFEDIEYGKIDLTKPAYKRCLSEFKIVDHCLTFKGNKVLCGGDYVLVETENGAVR